MVDREYPATVSHLRLPNLSDNMPDAIFVRLAVVSATPSISPMTAVRTPSTLARKNGIRLTSISEETSVSNDVIVTTHTLRGKRLRAFSFCIPPQNYRDGMTPPLPIPHHPRRV